jgi:hypothetical protein
MSGEKFVGDAKSLDAVRIALVSVSINVVRYYGCNPQYTGSNYLVTWLSEFQSTQDFASMEQSTVVRTLLKAKMSALEPLVTQMHQPNHEDGLQYKTSRYTLFTQILPIRNRTIPRYRIPFVILNKYVTSLRRPVRQHQP